LLVEESLANDFVVRPAVANVMPAAPKNSRRFILALISRGSGRHKHSSRPLCASLVWRTQEGGSADAETLAAFANL
jgi:hypothetical protein